MSYRSLLEAKIAKKVTRAIIEHGLIEDGDRVMVGLSGGKDSWALIQILDVLRKRAPIDFSIVAVNVNSGYTNFRHDLVTEACAERGWELPRRTHDHRRRSWTTFSTTAIRRARCARGSAAACCTGWRKDVGATKIALGHHLDDFVETALLNLFFQGSLKAMPARLVSDNKQHIVIRPLVYVTEAEARAYTQEVGLPVIGCCCPACGDLSLKRQRIKRLIADLEIEHPDIKNSMIKALGHVVPSHLLDRRLQSRMAPRSRRRPVGTAIPCAPSLQRVSRASGLPSTARWSGRSTAVCSCSSASRLATARPISSTSRRRCRELRIFRDDDGRMNRSVADAGGALLVVSQFTLLGDVRKGRRPAFDAAAPPIAAEAMYERSSDACARPACRWQTGGSRRTWQSTS